ncbi:MAG: RNA-binding domain-containing protein [Tissierellaceae bacterium]
MRNETETVEFKKSTGEIKEAIISLVSMLNKHGKGRLIFGVSPRGKVVKNQISETSMRDISRRIYEGIEPRTYPVVEVIVIDGVEVIEVTVTGREQPYSAFGRYYIRIADEDRELGTSELKRMIIEKSYKDSWEDQLTNYNLSDIDENALRHFFDQATKHGRLLETEYNPENILKKLGLYQNDKLTNAGYALFSNRSPITLKMAIFATDEKLTFLDIKTVEDNIYNLIKEAQIYVEKNIRWSGEIIDFTRTEVPEIPTEALREIIVNSFAHAQYNTDTYHEIRIHPSKVVVYSPGKFESNYSPEEYMKLDLPSSIRNTLITKVLYMAKAIEQFGSGFKRVNSLCNDSGINYSYEMYDQGFEFTFYREKIISLEKGKKPDANIKISSQAEITFEYLKVNPGYTREELSQLMSKHIRTIQRYLNELVRHGYIERIGSDKTGYWKIKK